MQLEALGEELENAELTFVSAASYEILNTLSFIYLCDIQYYYSFYNLEVISLRTDFILGHQLVNYADSEFGNSLQAIYFRNVI